MVTESLDQRDQGRSGNARPYRILIVDDEEHVRNTLRAWFVRIGFDVELAEDGQVAVERFRDRSYDIITMDIEMPRLNGLDAIETIRQTDSTVPIIILTGFTHDVNRARKAGAQRILNKPLSLRDLEQEVRALLAESQPAIPSE